MIQAGDNFLKCPGLPQSFKSSKNLLRYIPHLFTESGINWKQRKYNLDCSEVVIIEVHRAIFHTCVPIVPMIIIAV